MQAIEHTSAVPSASLMISGYKSISESGVEPAIRGAQTDVASYWLIGITTAAAVLAVVTSGELPTAPKDLSVTSHVYSEAALSPSVSQEREVALMEMLDYRDLETGWDGEGSLPPHRGAIDNAAAFLLAVPQSVTSPNATVSADGSVGWFWKSSEALISIQFSDDSYFAYYGESTAKNIVARGESIFDGKSIPDDLLQIMYLA